MTEHDLMRPPCWGPNENGDMMVDLSVEDYRADLRAALAEAEQKGAREALTAAANVFDSELAMQREHALPYNLIGVGAWLRDRAAQIGGDSDAGPDHP